MLLFLTTEFRRTKCDEKWGVIHWKILSVFSVISVATIMFCGRNGVRVVRHRWNDAQSDW